MAEAAGQVVAEREGGERPGHQQGDEEADGEDGGQAAEFTEALDPGEGAEDPEAESVVGLGGVDDDDAGEPAEGGAERRTGEDEPHGEPPPRRPEMRSTRPLATTAPTNAQTR